MAWVTAIGLAAGLAGAWALARVAESLMYGVTPHDPLTFIVVPLVLLVPVVLATLLPARRALSVNPADVMRTD
jgi:ABC-type lipoprotein release transport system permease subunit